MSIELSELLDNREPIDWSPAPEYAILLKDLQSNILTAHGYERAHYWFVKFREGEGWLDETRFLLGMLARSALERGMIRAAIEAPNAAKLMSKAVKQLAARRAGPANVSWEQHELLKDLRVTSEFEVTSRRRAEHEAKLAQQFTRAKGYSVNVLLTRAGYEKLGATPPANAAFRAGMAERGALLKDPELESWEAGYRQGRKKFGKGSIEIAFDGLLIVAYTPEPEPPGAAAQEKRIQVLREVVEEHAEIVCEELGDVLRVNRSNGSSYPIEPFGFRDSFSQPAFYEWQLRRWHQMGLAGDRFDPSAPLRLALVPDPNGRTQYACGSYVVFRKLEQDVDKFYQQSNVLADMKGWSCGAQLRARLVGREPDGTPLVAHIHGEINNFDFKSDPRGEQCPFYAHVRKVSPRGDVRETYRPSQHRVVRRGIPYGPQIERNADGTPKGDRVQYQQGEEPGPLGMLFMCAQADIDNQFEHLQARWANKHDHPRGRAGGVDTVMGQLAPGETNRIAIEDRTGNASTGLDTPYAPVVRLRGGEYFFAPSISFLRGLLDDLLAQDSLTDR